MNKHIEYRQGRIGKRKKREREREGDWYTGFNGDRHSHSWVAGRNVASTDRIPAPRPVSKNEGRATGHPQLAGSGLKYSQSTLSNACRLPALLALDAASPLEDELLGGAGHPEMRLGKYKIRRHSCIQLAGQDPRPSPSGPSGSFPRTRTGDPADAATATLLEVD